MSPSSLNPPPSSLKETFFEKFDQFADAPDAVAKMRLVVLSLAVQGKLVPQDPNDEPAANGLTRLAESGGNSKTRRSVPTDVRRPDTLFVKNLPTSWCIESTARLLHLGAICDLKDGNHGANHPKVAEFTETGLPFITAAQVSDDGWIDYEGAYKVSGEALDRLRVGFSKPNDVIYTHKGSVGRVAICDRVCVLTPQTTYYRVNDDVLCSGFLRTYLLSPLFRNQVDLVKRQTTRDFVSIKAQYQFFLRIPPLAEQKRIVAKVDELMALCDRLEAQQQERDTRHAALARASLARFAEAPTPANLHHLFHPSYTIPPADLRKSILTLAVQGKLVPQDHNDEPANKLLIRVSETRERLIAAKKIKRAKVRTTPKNTIQGSLPNTWAPTTLGMIGDWGSGSTPKRGNPEFYGGEITWLKSGELNDCKAVAGSSESITEVALSSGSFRRNTTGDVLIAMYGATIGKVAILAEPAVTNQAVCGCTPFDGIFNHFVFLYLLSQRANFHAASEGGAQPNISKEKLLGYPFPLPPLAEQRRIVAKVDQLMALVDELETQLAASRATAKNLLQALVAELTSKK